jgi:hypothetical protein
MKPTFFLILLLLFSCNKKAGEVTKSADSVISADTAKFIKPTSQKKEIINEYSNQRFRKVTVSKVAEHTFRIRGEAQIFEASFSWIVEDGHNELKKGFQMTDAGAPEWGKFDFIIEAEKKDANSTLHLVLFEISAKDGSRQYELSMPLY